MKAASLRQQRSKLGPSWIICRCEELSYRLLIAPLIAFLPAPLAYRLACLRGDWSYRLDEEKRRQILCNLAGVFGEQLSLSKRQSIAREVFRRRSCQAVDTLRLAGKGRALDRLVEIHGLEHIEAAMAAGKGAVICIVHFGSFVSCCSLLGIHGFPLTAVGNMNANPNNSIFQRFLRRFTFASQKPRHLRRPNIEPQQGTVEAAIHMAEILRANEILVIAIDVPVSDQDRAHAIAVDFLGRQIPLLPGGVSIAEHTGSSLLVAVAHRSNRWYQQVLDISPVALNGDTESAFRQCVSFLEAPIRKKPAFWDGWLSTRELLDLGLLPDETHQMQCFPEKLQVDKRQ
jgi:lauroyl/myristoyl acyltransferase